MSSHHFQKAIRGKEPLYFRELEQLNSKTSIWRRFRLVIGRMIGRMIK